MGAKCRLIEYAAAVTACAESRIYMIVALVGVDVMTLRSWDGTGFERATLELHELL